MQLTVTPSFMNDMRQILRQSSCLGNLYKVIENLADYPQDATLHSYKIKSKHANIWSCAVFYDVRILFKYIRLEDGKRGILLLRFKNHEKIY